MTMNRLFVNNKKAEHFCSSTYFVLYNSCTDIVITVRLRYYPAFPGGGGGSPIRLTGGGGTPSQVQGGTPSGWWGVPPSQAGGYPFPGLGGG